jgi:hypothetical protein
MPMTQPKFTPKPGQVVITEAPEYHKTYLVIPILATVSKTAATLDWEASKAQWFEPQDIKQLKLLPGFLEIAAQFFPEILPTAKAKKGKGL